MFTTREDPDGKESDSEESNFAEEDELTKIIPPAGMKKCQNLNITLEIVRIWVDLEVIQKNVLLHI